MKLLKLFENLHHLSAKDPALDAAELYLLQLQELHAGVEEFLRQQTEVKELLIFVSSDGFGRLSFNFR